MKKPFALLFLLHILSFGTAQTDSIPGEKPAPFQVQGYVKDLQTVSFSPQKGSLYTGNLLHNRLNFKYQFSTALSARLELRTRLFWGEQVRLTPGFAQLIDYESGLMDLSWTPIKKTALAGHAIIDRLSLNWQNKYWDITLGRQRINWGVTTAWNPNDLFNAFNFFDFDYEERPGSDALRVRYSRDGMSGFDLALSREKAAKSTTAAFLYKFNALGYDFQALGAWYQNNLALGGGWAGNIGNAGFKGEATWFQPYNKLTDTSGTLSLTLEGNYTFESSWYLGGAYLYTGRGHSRQGALAQLALQRLSAEMLMPFKHTVLIQVAKQLTPLFMANLSLIYCPGPDALIVFPVFSYSLNDNWDLNLVAQSFFIPVNKQLKNEGNSLILRIKWGF
ncbi:MAG: hypothetical protein HUU01_05875 [Saprospiraceae bacterium]|nr:hypothetical protein [Saprospiraceae bacterium]